MNWINSMTGNSEEVVLGRTHTRQSCPSTFDHESGACLTSVSALYHLQAWHTSLALTVGRDVLQKGTVAHARILAR